MTGHVDEPMRGNEDRAHPEAPAEPAPGQPGSRGAAGEPADAGPPRAPSALTVALGSFLVLAAGALVAVIAVGDSAPLWLVGGWMLLAVALSLVIAAVVPSGRKRPRGHGSRAVRSE